jgi:hypothetical protein
MARDSLFNEQIIWSGRAKTVHVPLHYRLGAVALLVTAASTLCFAAVLSRALHVHVGGMVAFSGWCASLALAAWRLPLIWRSGVEYLVTDKHVIWRRGRIRRVIDRDAVSYALIRWSRTDSTCGDLVLVRAVPTGALRRTLSLTLSDVEAPDRVWSIVRGVAPGASLGDGSRALAQRLDDGERVVWTAVPMASPWTVRRVISMAIATVLALAALRTVLKAVPPIAKILRLHALPPGAVALLVLGVALGALLLVAVAAGVGYSALVLPSRLARVTRYFVTNRRVLIHRGQEELHLDRGRIAYVIAAPQKDKVGALHDLFLVLDGPRARALAPMGAFGGQDRASLVPVFASIEDAETVGALLRENRAEIRDAA